MNYQFTASFAKALDIADEIAHFREEFHIPQHDGKDVLYFTGNSLGLQPKNAKKLVLEELESWENLGVEGHFKGKRPWFNYHEYSKTMMSVLVGASINEVVVMNSLTTNLHLLMVSFYHPSKSRFKIITEAGAFPSDQYALESQVRFHGFNPDEAIIELTPRKGEDSLRTKDIVKEINKHKDALALVMMSGVQYFTGQLFNMKAITQAGHNAGAMVGFDLAHAVGNVPLSLHNWDVDFAVWCTYKYLNSGPGSLAGAFIHERYANDNELPRFAGWWGHNEEERFLMQKGFVPMAGADGWQLSNVNVLPAAAILASLEIFGKVDFNDLRKKSLNLTGYAEFLINQVIDKTGVNARIITPANPDERGCQLSIALQDKGKQVFDYLTGQGIILDWRQPDLASSTPAIIRLAPVPLYNTYSDVYEFALKLEEALTSTHG